MAKQTLYEFLGVSQDADGRQIAMACRVLRGVIEHDPDPQHRQNQLIFLRHTEDILSNPDKRRDYDARLLRDGDGEPIADDPRPAPSWRALALLGLLLASAAWAWQHAGQDRAADASSGKGASAVQAKPGPIGSGATGDIDAFAAAFPPGDTQGKDPAGQAGQNVEPAQAKAGPQYQVQVDGPYAQLLSQLTWSVFAIAGSSGFGTGVLIDDEKLLTNCHTIAHNAGYNRKLYAINSVTRQRVEITRVAFMAYRGEDACLAIAPGLQGQPVQLGNVYALRPGSKVHNIGFALGKLTASDGQFSGIVDIGGQGFIESTNYCDHGVSGGPLVDDAGALVGLTTGGPADRSRCYSLSIETAKRVLYEPTIRPQDFPTNYVSNVVR